MILIIMNLGPKIRHDMIENVLSKTLERVGCEYHIYINVNSPTSRDNKSKLEQLIRKVLKKDSSGMMYFQLVNIGNAKGLNYLLNNSRPEDFKAIAKLDDDILLPENWGAHALKHIEENPQTGIVGFHCVLDYAPIPEKAFGSWVINIEAFKKAGYFYDKLGLYGCWDSEYNYRLKRNGFTNVYLGGKNAAIHYGINEDPEYRQFKNDQLRISRQLEIENAEEIATLKYYDPNIQ
jgi:GT2 family glycosyltransferase